jgi:anti-anti-sigma factor
MTLAMNAKKTVLVIDDETATLTMFRLFLNAYGYSVLTAETGETGLRLVREHHPGIVFTDLKMPGMDGFEVLKQIKQTAPATEVVVITGHGDMDHVIRALNLNATDFINKPIGRSALDAALKRAEARLKDHRRDSVPLQVEISSGVGIVSIHGTLSGLHKDLFTAYLHRALDSGAKGIVIRFDNFSAVNGTGIALLTRLISEARAAGTPVYIAGLSENFKTIFDMVGITRVAPCVDTAEAAMSAMGKNKSV